MPKYEKQINELFELLHEDWMTDKDKIELQYETLKSIGKTMEDLSAEIEVGVKNGFSPEVQMDLIRRGFAAREKE